MQFELDRHHVVVIYQQLKRRRKELKKQASASPTNAMSLSVTDGAIERIEAGMDERTRDVLGVTHEGVDLQDYFNGRVDALANPAQLERE